MERPEDTYTRRISAVLVADVSGFSALMGLDDEQTARDVRRVQALVGSIVTDLQGRAEPQAGDSICASFESVVAAVDAALQVQERLAAEDESGRPLRLRIGIHFGDVLLTPEGGTLGDAINVAARLCALARPDTICISEGVYRHVRARLTRRVQDLGRRRLKNISDPVHAYLVLPSGVVPSRRAIAVPVVGGVALALMTFVLWWVWSRPPVPLRVTQPLTSPGTITRASEPVPAIMLGVMLFKGLGAEGENDWMREALRDGLNAQLYGLPVVKVYSKEFIDGVAQQEGLSEIAVATKLGISKMLSGSFVDVGGKLRIETHVVDVGSGMLESSVTVLGAADRFAELQTTLVEAVITRLKLPVTDEERKTLLAQRSTDADALRLLLEAEGGAVPPPDAPPGRGSSLRRWLGAAAGPAVAWADDRTEILAILEHYRKAMEAREVAAVATVFVEYAPEQRAAQQRYFDNVRELRIAFADPDVAVRGDQAVVSYTRVDDFADATTGRPVHLSVRLTKTLARLDGRWRIK